MKKGPAKAGPKASSKQSKSHCSEAFAVLQPSPGIDRVPAKYLTVFRVPSTDRQDVAALWLALARQGVILPRPPGIIIMRGGRA